MSYSIDELREMLTEWAGWGETMADGRIGSVSASRFLADFERLVRVSELREAAEEFQSATPDGEGNGRAYNSYTVASILLFRAVSLIDNAGEQA